jgi:hypothetical protein
MKDGGPWQGFSILWPLGNSAYGCAMIWLLTVNHAASIT